jgi:hypothetical protein
MKNFIEYKAGYKYQVTNAVQLETGILPKFPIATEKTTLSVAGVMTISKGYAWDGPSGPTIDTESFMAGSLCHDAIYEMLRLEYLPAGQGYRRQADLLLYHVCRENGMFWLRAIIVYAGVRIGAGPAAKPINQRRVLRAPAMGWRNQ